MKTTAGFRLFAKSGVRMLMNCTGRSAMRCDLTWRHLPTLREFPTQERIALQLED